MYYFWNEDSLVSMCLEEDGQLLYNSRIIYDADGEAMGMCLNDSGTFLYQKDLQGDIVALISPDGYIVLEYIYDSYGNININTPDNSVGSAILAMFILALNPLSYRGYLYAPGIGVSYYLGSRFYSPQICRFMNADVYQDTGTGAVGTNMFAYCNNNPVSFVDPTGEAAGSILTKMSTSAIILLVAVTIAAYVTALIPIFSGGQVKVSLSESISYTKAYLKNIPNATAAAIAAYIIILKYESDLKDIASGYGLFQCVEATKAMVAYMIKKGIDGKIVHLQVQAPPSDNHTNIYSISKNKVISINGNHFGVLFNDQIFCNVHPKGLYKDNWYADFDAVWNISITHYPLSWNWNE